MRAGAFVVLVATDHCYEDPDECPDNTPEQFLVYGQLVRIDTNHYVVEGAWEWMNACDDEPAISYGRHYVVRGAVNTILPHPGPAQFAGLRERLLAARRR